MTIRLVTALLVGLLAAPIQAARLLPQDAMPDGISPGCDTALAANVDCSHAAAALRTGIYYPKSEPQSICTDRCALSLASYHGGISSACASDVWQGIYKTEEPVAMISEMLRYHYNLTCLSDGSRFCNNVAAAFSVSLDPDTAALPGGLPAGGDYGGYDISDPCDKCLVSLPRFQAASPYYNGPDLQESSLYQSKTSSCGINNMPLTTTSLVLITTTSANPPAPTCAGDQYALQPGDDCRSVSLSQGIGTDLLLTDNGLAAFCHEFPKQGKLCLVNKCETHTVVEGDSCKAITREYGMSDAQLRAWNPDMVGYQLCVNKPGEPYISPAPTTLAPSVPITPAPVPTEVADGTNRRCGRFYKVAAGDYCNLICLKFGISLDDFIFLNSAINENCTNLYADLSYCVQAVGDINTYSGRPGYVTYTFGVTRTAPLGDPATGLPDVAWSSPTATTTQAPLASGSRGDCNNYLNGDNFQKDLSNSALKSNCDLVAQVYGVSLEDLGIWNPALGDASDAGCAFERGVRYCAKYYEGDKPAASDDGPVSEFPPRDGMAKSCVETVDVDETGTPTCQEILDMYELTIAQFYAWNPSVGPDCGGMWAGYQYCVQAKGGEQTQSSTTTSPASMTTTTSSGPGPTAGPIKVPKPNQPGNAVASCSKYAQAQDGDWCAKFAERNGIRTEDLYAWNKALGANGENCDSAFWANYWYCVGVAS